MDDMSQTTGGYPSSGPPIAGPSAGQPQPSYVPTPYASQPDGAPPGYPPVYPPGSWEQPPPAKRNVGWLIAGGIVVFFLLVTIGMCAWVGTLINGSGSAIPTGDAVALIHIDGVISGTSGGLAGSAATPEAVLSQLRQAGDDRSVKAVLLRVDSPGGTVAASEEIATEVARFKKPVVVSIGDVGASGAYMVSSQADWIIATPGSSVGSIGVILEVPNLEGLLNKLGVKFAVITAGKYKSIGSPFRSLTATETKMLQQQVDLVYNQFIDMVATGRKLPKDKVLKLATGMAWVGTQAKVYGLVDQIGTYNDAVAKAGRLGNIRGTPRIVEYGSTPYSDLLDALFGLSGKLDKIGDALGAGTAGTGAANQPLTR